MSTAIRTLLFSLATLVAAHASFASADIAKPAKLDSETVVNAIASDLSAHFNLGGELQLEMLRPWTPPARTAREWRVQLTQYPSALASSLLVRCRFLADGESAGEAVLTFRAMHMRDAWLARQPINVGAAFDTGLLDVRRTDFLRDRDALPADAGDGTYSFSRSVQSGRVLTWRDVGRRPLVRKGEMVEVTATDGGLLITLKGLAMQNGAQGDAVTIRNPDSRRDFTAFVVDENHVHVRF
ncbi:MAG TPA: flagellar basal body P-ring formation chaperone FlgA [Opitutaceae bacterium]|nr:flagellar basal body P-ring formation chaperone FlgA [Opitutaceae bacterium]